MKWIEVSVKTTTAAVEAVANVLYDAGVNGVAIEDPRDLELLDRGEDAWELVDESLADSYYEGAVVKGYLPDTPESVAQVELIRKAVEYLPSYGLDIGLGEVVVLSVDEEDWSEEWKKYFKPQKPGSKLVIKPTWESYEAAGDEVILELDPGMAFGTGTHETTIMCIQELEKTVGKSTTVLDIGCGSGILAIAAALLGARQAIGVDLDPVAVEVSIRNAVLNQVSDRVEIRQGNLMDVVSERADILVSNIIAEIIVKMCPDIHQYLKPGGIWIASGIINEKVPLVTRAIEEAGLKMISARSLGEWAVITAAVPGESTKKE
ncbi:50S ribosomal protein L11 methyltransferase [Anoxynatronum buryatiense]|uniref:Ribosomal protein L11 methyltransferase n=1 Tax=Anoxynatronum buryatiense TaxID=489973 RepID=A0AA45WSX9_9CLOT|nr:50S ribosomal protein L11 methyltransferase [Anoxynatronum buryatiense]SMP39552.1 [LSU ribosomal protein L11P]-lysine N-methyltransferase [Anoxynatronum buryatiense]